MKTINPKTIFMIIFLSLFITSCTDLNSDDEDLILDNTEITTSNDTNARFTGGSGTGEDGTGKGN